ncbi:LacI family DNA-binding transcriptional regulator [Novosphingobium sp.]|uniref:LacI family DNA-binding transcriptional regulator n=1 Tax=Novosphingobium sp. TaxID=1874826 RepID=UPI0038B82E4A
MQKRVKVTIEDVAAAAGVSRQTVSRVINNGPNVKPAVRQRIEAIVERLGYVPNISARRMGGARSYLILSINDRARTFENWQSGRGNDWVDQMLYGGMSECERHSYHIVLELIDTDSDSTIPQISRVVGSLRPDGVILTPPHCDNPALVGWFERQGIASARLGHREGGAHVDVFMDDAGAMREVTAHLLALGHRRIGFLAGPPSYGPSQQRRGAFEAALDEAGLPPAAGQVGAGNFYFDMAVGVLEAMLDSPEPPTAIIADNDKMAFAALHVAASRGLRVPDDLSVVSFEDTPAVRLSVPPLTAIRQPTAAMIGKACAQLIAISRGEEGLGAFELPYEFVVRASTAAPRA